jgi:hypothetical protein
MSTSRPGHGEKPQFTPEAQPEIIIPSDEIYGVLRGFDGTPLTGDAVWSIRRRGGSKYFSSEAIGDRFTTFTPGPEHQGTTWGKVIEATTNTLLTLSRRAIIGGETQPTKSEGYIERQAKMRDRILEITALVKENDPSAREHVIDVCLAAEDEYGRFIYPDVEGELPDRDKEKVGSSLENLLVITTKLANANPSGEASV